LPEFDVVAIDVFVRVFDRSDIVESLEVDRFLEAAVMADDLRSIFRHRAGSQGERKASVRSHDRLSHGSRCYVGINIGVGSVRLLQKLKASRSAIE
jgi:hypothetical protein